MGDIFKVDKPDGTFFYAVEVDIPDAVYLVNSTRMLWTIRWFPR